MQAAAAPTRTGTWLCSPWCWASTRAATQSQTTRLVPHWWGNMIPAICCGRMINVLAVQRMQQDCCTPGHLSAAYTDTAAGCYCVQGGQPVVDTAVAQQVADGWQAGPVVGTLSAATVQGILADAQATAKCAVIDSPGKQQLVHSDSTPADSVRTSSDQHAAVVPLPSLVGAELQPANSTAVSDGMVVSSDASAASEPSNATFWASDVSTAWAAASRALLHHVPRQFAATLQRLQQRRAVQHLEASLGASTDLNTQVGKHRIPSMHTVHRCGHNSQD
jgi:hypothetical protein